MPKIILDAGHGGYDNGAVYNGRKEKDDNLSLTLAVGEILSDSGVEVGYTRVDDVYQSPVDKARIANQSVLYGIAGDRSDTGIQQISADGTYFIVHFELDHPGSPGH